MQKIKQTHIYEYCAVFQTPNYWSRNLISSNNKIAQWQHLISSTIFIEPWYTPRTHLITHSACNLFIVVTTAHKNDRAIIDFFCSSNPSRALNTLNVKVKIQVTSTRRKCFSSKKTYKCSKISKSKLNTIDHIMMFVFVVNEHMDLW